MNEKRITKIHCGTSQGAIWPVVSTGPSINFDTSIRGHSGRLMSSEWSSIV